MDSDLFHAIQAYLRGRWMYLRRDAGMTTLEMSILTGILVVVAGAFVVAMNSKVREKIAAFMGA